MHIQGRAGMLSFCAKATPERPLLLYISPMELIAAKSRSLLSGKISSPMPITTNNLRLVSMMISRSYTAILDRINILVNWLSYLLIYLLHSILHLLKENKKNYLPLIEQNCEPPHFSRRVEN